VDFRFRSYRRCCASSGSGVSAKVWWEPIFAPMGFGAPARQAEVRSVAVPFVGVVDDDEALCLSLVDLMRSTGYRAEPFGSADTLLVSSSLSSVDCIIADVHMPGTGGIGLVRELRRRAMATPVILITALLHAHLDDEAASVGAFCLLRKPFETSALLHYIERSLFK
jgi:FixJ family two-component response regulator